MIGRYWGLKLCSSSFKEKQNSSLLLQAENLTCPRAAHMGQVLLSKKGGSGTGEASGPLLAQLWIAEE